MTKLLQTGDYGSADQPGAACYRNAHVHLLTGEISRSRAIHPPLSLKKQGNEGHAASIHPFPHAPKRRPVPSDRARPTVSVPLSGGRRRC